MMEPQPPVQTAQPDRPLPPRDDAAFDAWLRPILDRAYDAVLHEAVPPRLLRALRRSKSG